MPGKLKVYISSTFLDMENAREKIIDRINNGLSPYFELTEIMEKMKGDPANRPNIDICRAEVRKADLYILLTGKRYGSHPDVFVAKNGSIIQNTEGKSYTELEYDAACETISEKFYGIYKLELTDDFFTGEKINEYSDLADAERKAKYNSFRKKLDETVSAVEVKSGDQLEKTLNNKLTEFYLKYNTKQELNITPFEKASIDRKEQLQKIQAQPRTAGALAFLIELEDESDCYDEFTTKLQAELTRKSPDKVEAPHNSGIIAGLTFQNNGENLLNRILFECSVNIYGEAANAVTFEQLALDLMEHPYRKNHFISFIVDCKTDFTESPVNFTEVIAAFIKKIDNLLKNQPGFIFNFYFPVFFFSHARLETNNDYTKFFDGIQYLPVGRLPDVKLDDAKAWIEKIKAGREIDADADSLLNMIFIDTKTFPAKYKKCITLIDKRTK